jgi:hypothetical protein
MSVVIDPPKVGFDSPILSPVARIEVVCSDGRIAVSVAGDLCGSGASAAG